MDRIRRGSFLVIDIENEHVEGGGAPGVITGSVILNLEDLTLQTIGRGQRLGLVELNLEDLTISAVPEGVVQGSVTLDLDDLILTPIGRGQRLGSINLDLEDLTISVAPVVFDSPAIVLVYENNLPIRGNLPSSWDKGDLVRIRAVFTDENGAAMDPSTVTFHYRHRDQALATSHTYNSGPFITRTGTGDYYVDVNLSASGMWFYKWQSSGLGQAVAQHRIHARRDDTAPE